MGNPKRLKVTLVRSPIGALRNHKACVAGLGLRRIRQTVDIEDTPSVRGMIQKARHLVRIAEEFYDWTRLTDSQWAQLRRVGKAMGEISMGFATPVYYADLTKPADVEKNINNGTGSLIQINGKQFCVTARHVLMHYRKRLAENPIVRFHIGNAQVDPEKLLADESERLDLVVFNVDGYSAKDLAIAGEIPTNFIEVDVETPSEIPAPDSFVMFGGYPKGRRTAKGREVEWASFGSGAAMVHESTDRNLICRVVTDRDAIEKAGFPKLEIPEMGGMSGGPVLRQKTTESGIIVLEVVGFIYEHGDNEAELDLLMIRPITFLNPDGTLKGR